MLRMARRVLVFLKVANWVVGAAIIVFMTFAGFVAHERIMAAIARNNDGVDPAAMITFIHISLLFMPLAIALSHLIFRSLLEMIDSIPTDQVFTYANANRLLLIAWALLGFSVAEHVYGFLSLHYVGQLAAWSPSLTGWLVSLLLFVLAVPGRHGATSKSNV